MSQQALSVVVGLDRSASAVNAASGIPHLISSDYSPLVSEINYAKEGALILGTIGATSRSKWARFELFNQEISPPVERRGEPAEKYLDRLMAWKKKTETKRSRPKVNVESRLKKI